MEAMTDAAPPESIRKVGQARKFYTVTAYVTGVLLLLLVAEMVLKYAFGVEVEIGGPFGFIALTPPELLTGFNLSRWVLIIHGWFYVVYLIASYLLWSRMRWPLWILLAMAGGGVVPFLSFVVEGWLTRRSRRELDEAVSEHAARESEDAELAAIEGSMTPEEREAFDAKVRAEARERAAAGKGATGQPVSEDSSVTPTPSDTSHHAFDTDASKETR